MRTTLVVDRWDASRGGQEGYLDAIVGELARRGVDVRVLCREAAGTRPGVEALALAPPGGGAAGERRFLSAAARKIGAGVGAEAEAHEGPVLAPRLLSLATHVVLPGGLFADALEGERESMDGARRAFFRLGTALNARRRLLARCERQALEGPWPRILVFTEAMKGRLAGLGVPCDAIRVSPPGIDISSFRPGPRPPEVERSVELLFLAHNARLKGLGAGLEALAVARGRGIRARLTVVGRAPQGPWRRRAARLGVGSAVTFEKHLSPPDVIRRLHGATALLHPTFLDPCSLACLEAAACGVPVITTRRNGAVERLGPAGAALVVDDPRDVEGLARAVEEAAEPSRHAALREAALALRPSLDARRHLGDVVAWLGVG